MFILIKSVDMATIAPNLPSRDQEYQLPGSPYKYNIGGKFKSPHVSVLFHKPI